MKWRRWTSRELKVLRAMYPNHTAAEVGRRLGRPVSSVYQRAVAEGLKKSRVFLESPASGRLRPGDERGKSGRFVKGQTPWNKGARYSAGGRSPETRFRKGHRPQTWVPVGTEVLDAEGYLKRKVRDDAPAGLSRRNWKYVHRMLWEEHFGPIPKGQAVVFRNGDKNDIRIENLELVTRAELQRRNSIHNLPEPLKEVIRLKGTINRQIRNRTRHGKEQD